MARVNLNFVADNDTDKAIAFKNFMGVDFTNTKMNVAPNRATNMKNYIYENGVNRKRPSWNEVAKGEGNVNGVWQYYDTNREEHIIAHIGTKLYRVFKRDETTSGFDINSVYTHLEELTLPIGVTLTYDISYGITNDEKLFLLCGAYLVYDGTDIKKATDIAYIPTTTQGISAIGSTLYKDKKTAFEKVNLLSAFETVTLFAEDTFNETPLSYTNPQVYLLNRGFAGTDATGFKLMIKTIVENEPTTIEAIAAYSNGKIYFNVGIDTIGEIDGNRFAMYKYYAPQEEGIPSLILTYRTRQFDNTIDKCTFGTLFNAQGGQFLFLSGNPDKPNYDWHSDYSLETATKTMSDFTYFPETSYTAIGSQNEKNIGYTILGDGSMAIHKEATTKKDILYIRTSYLGNALGPLGEPVTDIYGNAMKEVFFTINQSAVGEGMIARNTSDNLLGDNLFLSRNGVFGLALSQNITSSERYALDRSGLINGKLTQEENLKNATAIAFDNRYYLAVNGNCYVADARFKNYISTDMPDTFSYEWWFWDNIPARLFFVINNELYFGTEQGQICKFVFDRTDLNDKTYIAVDSITYNDGVFTIPEAYDELIEQLKDGDGIRIKELVLEGENEVEYDLQYDLFENQEEVNTMDFEVPIAKINENGDFVLVNHITSDGTVVPYDIKTREGHSGFVAYFILKNKVVSFFTLPITNFGTSLFAKKITGISITPEKITNSIANILIRTRNFKEKEVDVSNAGLFNFADIDFANFTFDTDDFYTSINKKLNIKCNYAEVTFASTNDRDSILHEIVLT